MSIARWRVHLPTDNAHGAGLGMLARIPWTGDKAKVTVLGSLVL